MKKKSITRCLRDEANEVLNRIEHDLTRNSYKNIVRRYIEYCRKEFDVKSLEDCKGYIQVYCDSLDARGLSASTVHTYCAAICKVFNVPMALINKKIRHISEYTNGLTKPLKNYRSSADLSDERWKKIVDFQSRVGIRRSITHPKCNFRFGLHFGEDNEPQILQIAVFKRIVFTKQ